MSTPAACVSLARRAPLVSARTIVGEGVMGVKVRPGSYGSSRLYLESPSVPSHDRIVIPVVRMHRCPVRPENSKL